VISALISTIDRIRSGRITKRPSAGSRLAAIYEIWKWHFELKRAHAEPQSAPLAALPSLEAAP
jgi:hypothetical protein